MVIIITMGVYINTYKSNYEILGKVVIMSNNDIDSLLLMLERLKENGSCDKKVIDSIEDGIIVASPEELDRLLSGLKKI